MISTKTLYLTVVLFVVNLCTLQAQQQDELLYQLKNSKPGTQKINTLLQLSDYYIFKESENKTNLDSAFTFTQQAEKESQRIQYQRGIARSFALYSRIYEEQRNKDKTLYFANKALKIALANNYQDICGEAYREIYSQFNYYDEISAKTEYLEKAITAFRLKSTKLQLADILTIAAEHYNYLGETDKPIALIKEALSLYKAARYNNMVNPYRVAGSLYAGRGDYKKGIDYSLKAATAAEGKAHVNEQLSFIYNQLASIYHHLNDNRLSEQYQRTSLIYAEKDNNTEMVYTAANNIIYNLLRDKKYTEAETFLKRIYSRNKPVSIADIFTVNDCFLNIYTKMARFATANVYAKKMIELIKDKGADVPKQIMYNAHLALCRFYLAKGDYATARTHLDTNLKNIDQRSYTARKGMYTFAYQLDSAQGNLPQAIVYLKKLKTIDDSIFNIEKNKEISQLEISYETDKKDKDIQLKAKSISLLSKEKELQKRDIQRTSFEKNIAIAAVIFALIGALAILYAYRKKLVLTNLLQKQKAEITTKNSTLNKLVDEKEWLLKEIHHRVKNNLQVVMSLLNTQSAYMTDESAKAAINDSQRRVHSIALIHQQLYKSEDVSAIKIYRYITELISYLKDTYDSAFVKFDIEVDDVEFDIAQTMPIGLILNEAITNCFKYAFSPGQKGLIKISLCKHEGDLYELLIADNGNGLPADFDPDNSNSLGMDLLTGLSGDLNGDFKIYNNNGATVKIVFNPQQAHG